jgi:eukaryotic-like serine/threonine-protein kinase
VKTCPQCKMRYPNDAKFCFVEGADLTPLEDPRIGMLLAGRYVLEDVIGEGGMATVYRARHKLVDRLCAVKILAPMYAADQVVRERFRREAKSAQKLSHPNIIEIFDQGEADDQTAYMVMEYLKGQSLADLIAKGPIPIARALGLMIQISRGIARAHDFEVIHRDLKPENIFLCTRDDGADQVKLLDFGIARSRSDSRLTGAGELFGTPHYMAPERITAGEAGPSIDLYAIGVIFFEMLTGQLPFEAPDIPTFFIKHLKEPPPSPRKLNSEIPPDLEALVLRLLAKDAKSRPVDAHRVENDLHAVARQTGAPIPQEPETDPESSRPKAISLPAVGIEAWQKRTALLEQMLARAFAGGAPAEMSRTLAEVKSHVRRIAELRSRSMTAQRSLEQIEQRGRDGRQRFGFAVEALAVDASKAKDVARAAKAKAQPLEEASKQEAAKFALAHKEITYWEGRCGFQEPTKDLAAAYGSAANVVDSWLAARADELKAIAEGDTATRAVNDLEFQIDELRAALAHHEQSIEDEQQKCELAIGEAGKLADQLETELVALTTRFCEPLRRRPELSPLFKELEGVAA